ncbi:ABC transporter ATP-binding protein [Candidatus Woesearchaeota archaeon]|nr:ABC transporter ATP-binding protein [Candidatus Woesearchaeota archaeon]
MPNPILRFKNVTKAFGDTVVLEGINLDIFSGEIFGVIGASGSGKTTFLSALIGFVPVDTGDVMFKEEHLLDFHDSNEPFRSIFSKIKDVKKVFGFASQTPSFYLKLTVYENLEYFGTLYGLTKDARKTNINTLLNLMELKNKQDTLAENLSGGMQRRLDIACALMHDPKVLILDEPTADLDPFLRKHILKLIRKINKKGTTIILSSHNLAEIETLCTRVGILHKTKFLAVGTPDQIKEKFSKNEEIHIETFPGNYEKLSKKFKNKSIDRMEDKGTELVIYTSKPETVLHQALHIIESSNESLIDVRLSKPSLDEVFLSLAKGTRKHELLKKQEENDKDVEANKDNNQEL